MFLSHFRFKPLACSAIVGCTLGSFVTPAFATQPLQDFILGARSHGFDARLQAATVKQRDWEVEVARGRLLPVLGTRVGFTRNQYAAELPSGTLPGQTDTITILPHNQVDTVLSLDVPLVELASVARLEQANHVLKANEAGVEATGSQLDRSVAYAYYSYLGAEALVLASEKSLEIAKENLAYVTAHAEAGMGTDFDLLRASANVERAEQERAQAEYLSIQAARELQTLSGLTVTAPTHFPEDDLHPEAPLDTWLERRDTPHDRVQRELYRAAQAGKKAAAYANLPVLSLGAQERLSNATGFTGKKSSYALMATLTFRFDYSTHANARAQSAAADVQAIQVERTRREVEDTIFDAYHLVETSITRSRSARAQADSARRSADLALERYKAGTATQLDVTESQKEAFSAESSRIRADADLGYARLLLRVAAGLPAVDQESPALERVEE